jgi:hypothetical protein
VDLPLDKLDHLFYIITRFHCNVNSIGSGTCGLSKPNSSLVTFEEVWDEPRNFKTRTWRGDASILAIAFCGIDFAGIARLFTPEEGADEPGEVWYLFGAWLLAATMNAMLTWWGVSLAILNHQTLGNAVIDRNTLLRAVPIFVAVLVWLIRVLIIGTFSVAGDRLFSQGDRSQAGLRRSYSVSVENPAAVRSLGVRRNVNRPAPISASAFRPAPKPAQADDEPAYATRPEPTYHPVAMSGQDSTSNGNAPKSYTMNGANKSGPYTRR